MFLSNLLDSPEPTIFELSMAANLQAGLQPAFEYVLRMLGERYSSVFPIYAWKDEVFLGLLALIQRHYLSVYDGSFSENFYALKRVKMNGKGEEILLNGKDKLLSLLALTVGPYFCFKLAKLHAEKKNEENLPLLEKKVVRNIPYLFAGYETWAFFLKISFMFKKTKYYTPLDWLQGIVIARVTGDDMRAQMLREERLEARRGILGKMLSKTISFLRTGLVASALIFKLLEWYYSPENQSQRESMKGPNIVPPPPQPPRQNGSGIRLPRDPRLCPLCHEPRVNPAISSSGVAYCYICIHRFVLEHGQCPLTGTPCEVTQIRRIFES